MSKLIEGKPTPLWITRDSAGVRVWDGYFVEPEFRGDYFARGTSQPGLGSLGPFCGAGFKQQTGIGYLAYTQKVRVFVAPFRTKKEAQLALDLVARARARARKVAPKKKPAGRSAGRRTRQK